MNSSENNEETMGPNENIETLNENVAGTSSDNTDCLMEKLQAEALELEENLSENEQAFKLTPPGEEDDDLWKARTGLNEDSLCGTVETIIFMSERPISLNKIKKLIDEDMPLRAIHQAIERLRQEYEEKHHGLRLAEVAEGHQFRTKATYAKYVHDLYKTSTLKLGQTALEVLAIIAYKQPVSKTEVDRIRGVDSSHIVRGLMDKRLVKATGRSQEMGRPTVYGTTAEFLEVFNLAAIDQLPSEHELDTMLESDIGKISDIKKIVHTGDKQKFFFDDVSEIDQLHRDIKSISPNTSFTKSLISEDRLRKKGEGHKTRSAFDIMEEHLVSKELIEQNQNSSESEPFMPTFAEVVQDLSAFPLNTPDDDDFEMIDLDTGESISVESEAEDNLLQASEALEAELFASEDNELIQTPPSLEDELGRAFESLRIPGQESEIQEEMDQSLSAGLDDKEEKLEELTAQTVAKGKDFGIDLDFLGETDQD